MSIYSAPKSFVPRTLTVYATVLGTTALSSALTIWSSWIMPSFAQSIRASGDTNTRINQITDGVSGQQRYDIQGSTVSADGKNLFHSLSEFGLSSSEIANFISNPNINNILTRVVGGDASIIDGLIQVTGGDSNLYLMNPAGLFFGENASLNVPADFTATTANGIGFGDDWFSAVGANDYADLLGTPDRLAFGLSQPGAIVNEGALGVGRGDRLTLIGGTVINTGTLTTEGGQITLAAVPGDNVVRLSQANQLLNLEFQTIGPADSLPNALPFVPATLPTLLTGGSVTGATDITVNADGTISLTGSDVAVAPTPGTVMTAGTLDTSNIAPPESTVETAVGGQVQVLGDRVALLNATVDASGTNGGGTVWLGGEFQGQGTTPTASRTLVDANSIVAVDALENGDGGEAIVWADDVTGFYGTIFARGGATSGDGGFVEVSGAKNLTFDGTVDTTAANGINGQLLLDPRSVYICDAVVACITPDGFDFTPDDALDDQEILATESFPAANFIISPTQVETALGNGDVTISAARDLRVLSAIEVTNPDLASSLSLNAPLIEILASITLGQGDLNITALDGTKRMF